VLCVSVPEGMKGWPVVLRNPLDSTDILMRFDLKEGAISGSGRKKGQHIIDPRSIEAGPVTFSSGAWALASDAISADALSTAFMMFSDEEINEYCLANSGTAAIISGSEGVSDSTGQRYKKFGQI
jgi:thiamine biosynthesis lipoprotein ApbE